MAEPAELPLSPWWRWAALLVMAAGFAVLIVLSAAAPKYAPPIPEIVADPAGRTVFTGDDVRAGQQVFLRHGLMDNGTVWGHGAYLGPDYSAAYLHALSVDGANIVARRRYAGGLETLSPLQRATVEAEVGATLKTNRYDPRTRQLAFTEAEALSFRSQIDRWKAYFAEPSRNGGLRRDFIRDAEELRQLTAFFAWTAWASVAARPGRSYSYTNNFPYDPSVGNTPTKDAVLWSALSLCALLGGIAVVLAAFERFLNLGWREMNRRPPPHLRPGSVTASQGATLKLFVVVALLLLAQTLVGGATAHYRANPGSFYGLDLSALLPSNLLRTWHLQLAIFAIATAYVAGALFVAPTIGAGDPRGQTKGVNALFGALLVVGAGSLGGEWLGIGQLLPRLWFWVGHQGWEYLELGRVWQVLLAAALVFWLALLYRAVSPAFRDPEYREVGIVFLLSALAIPAFYLPALFIGAATNFTVVEVWRFWIIHLWVEGFFELFVTVIVAVIFYQLGIASRTTAMRVIYLDAILYFAGGVIGTGHHWYWTGQSTVNMAFAAVFSALEVVPLTLLTLDAWDFVRLTGVEGEARGHHRMIPHRWTFYFLMAVGFWNFTGAGVFGFLINLPIVSYFEVGTILTPNHSHAAMMGVFGMLAIALMVFAMRQASSDADWPRIERFVRIGFWGLNGGLLLMVVLSLFPGGVLQLLDVLENGYWHARSLAYTGQPTARLIEWLRLSGDLVFIFLGVAPMLLAAAATYWNARRARQLASAV